MTAPTTPTTPRALRHDQYDALAWSFSAQDVPELETVSANLALSGAPGLARDLFASFLRARLEQDPQGGANLAHATFIREALETRELATLRERTRGDEAACSLGVIEAGRVLEAGLPGAGTDPDALRQLAREACRVAREAIEQADQAARGLYGEAWGRGTHEGQARTTSKRALIEARDMVLRTRRGRGVLEAILREAGRLRRIRDRVRATRTQRGPGAIIGTELGRDPARVLPSELASLAAPGPLAVDFARRLVEGQALQFRTRQAVPAGRGPIVVCLDQSGSMAGPKEVWSKALVLCLLELASQEGRAFALIPFSSGEHGPACSPPWIVPARRQASPQEILDQLEGFRSGGTDFEAPLREALRVIDANAGELKLADVVFVTDGLAPISPEFGAEWSRRTQARGTQLHAILIGTSSAACDLDPLADSAVRVPTLADEGDALESAFSVGLN